MQVRSSGTQADRQREERDEVIAWRRRQLVAAGFAAGLAGALAGDFRMDLHALLELVERGCPPVLAARIQSPADDPGDEEGSRW